MAKLRKPKSAIDEFMSLPDEEKERIYEQFDEEFVGDTFRPLTPEQRRLWNKARRRGRPKVGAGAKRVLITIEARLLAKADALAKKTKRTRSSLIAEGLETVLNRK